MDASAARSLVVMPLFAPSKAPFGGIYVTHSRRTWFEECKGVIVALAGLMQSLLDEQVLLPPSMEAWNAFLQVGRAVVDAGVLYQGY